MSDKERNDVPSQIDWLARFTSKVGLGACICEGQEISAAIDEIERLTAELETERMRLTACGVAALANTADSAARARDIRPEYRSASLDDVERAVDREIQLRDERDELRRQLAEAEMDAERGIGG